MLVDPSSVLLQSTLLADAVPALCSEQATPGFREQGPIPQAPCLGRAVGPEELKSPTAVLHSRHCHVCMSACPGPHLGWGPGQVSFFRTLESAQHHPAPVDNKGSSLEAAGHTASSIP